MLLPANNSSSEETVRKTVLILVAVALNILELAIPRIPLLPWLKPGLANSITLIWIIRYGTVDALLFTVIRVWVSSFYSGFSLITITLALSGGILSTVAMGQLWQLSRKIGILRAGTTGIAVIGAVMHNIGQLSVVYLLLARNSAVIYQLPAMGAASLLFGLFTGLLTPALWNIICNQHHCAPVRIATPVSHLSKRRKFLILLCAGSAVLLLAVSSTRQLLAVAAVVTIIASITVNGKKRSVLTYPFKFWYLFIFITVFNLFFSYGTRIGPLPFITREGYTEAVQHALRLWSWLEISLLMQQFKAHLLFFSLLRRAFPHRGDSLAAALLALEFFPDVVSFAKSTRARKNLPWQAPSTALPQFADRVRTFIVDLITSQQPPLEKNSKKHLPHSPAKTN